MGFASLAGNTAHAPNTRWRSTSLGQQCAVVLWYHTGIYSFPALVLVDIDVAMGRSRFVIVFSGSTRNTSCG